MSTQPNTANGERLEFLGSRRFQLKRHLGDGSMGSVHLAYDRERGAEVALKTLRRADAMSIYRFKREFRALSDVVHPNLVALYDLFHDGDLWYFTMEYVHGQDFLSYVLGRQRGSASPSTPDTFDPVTLTEDPRPLRRGLELIFPTPLQDEERLRDVLVQVAEGLHAIHAAGRLHRDLKSDNVIVTADGRAKVLDFGIAIERAAGNQATLELGVMGTPAYMSPEQAAGLPVDEATDWYALGVMLYEALTGNVPFDGGYLDVMNRKQHVDATPPSKVVSGVPPDLETLCVALLQRRPADRPDGAAVLRALERRTALSSRPPRLSSIPADPDAPFVGRVLELAELTRQLAQTDRGTPAIAFVHGPSGMGKTTLAERFIAEQRTGGDTVVLKGRCYERESVPFKAWDSLIDSLSRYLRRLPQAEAAELLPREIMALAHLFPVLKRVDVVASARRRMKLATDRLELRRRAFAAFKELLCRLSDRTPLVLFIDDLQWGDVDSVDLLGELITGPDAPPMLLLLAYRSGEAADGACVQALLARTRQHDSAPPHEIALRPLSEDESVELARRLLGEELPAAARGIGVESQGNPHLLAELVRHVLLRKRDGSASADTVRGLVTFERALMMRVAELSPGATALLELLSVAGRPLAEDSLNLVSSFGVELQNSLSELRGAKLIRGVGTHARRAIETYHDRIREAVVSALPAERLELWHKRLASTLEATGSADLEAIVDHLIGAGDAKRAQIYAIRAATQAAEALAFDKAARLFAIAVEHQGDAGWGHELFVRWAESLVNAGRNREAAAVYFDAARAASPAEGLALRCKAGLQLLASGHEQDALDLLRDTLEGLGAQVPASHTEGAAELGALLERVARRGLALAVPAGPVPAALLDRLDTIWGLARGMAFSDPDRAQALAARYLLEALDAGEPARALRGLCLYEGLRVAPSGAAANGAPPGALAAAEALAATFEGDALRAPAEALLELARGWQALQLGELGAALRSLPRAEELFRTRSVGGELEMRMCRTAVAYLAVSFSQLERMRDLEAWAEEADEDEDLVSGTRLRLLVAFARLVEDRPERAERELSRTMARWGRERFDLTGALSAMTAGLIALYRGDPHACASAAARSEGFLASPLAAAPLLRGDALLLRARAQLCASTADPSPEAVLLGVEQDLRSLAALRLGCFEQRLRLLRAGLCIRRGDGDTALALLEAALSDDGDQLDARFALAAAERRKGQLIGGDAGAKLVLQADDALRAQGVRNPEAFARLFVPV